MSEPRKIIPLKKAEPDDKMIVTMTAAELRAIIRQEVRTAEGNGAETDEWVDIDAAAKIMGVSSEWIYHNRKRLPFASKIGRRLLRFSRNGLQRWMESKKA
jgi:predicted DNA-binding transcriptional regulator AlpA